MSTVRPSVVIVKVRGSDGVAGYDAMVSPGVVVHVSPHPDDEVIASGMTLQGLARGGWQVVNLLLGLGRPADRSRRRVEAEEAARRAGYLLDVVDPEAGSDADSDSAAVRSALVRHRPTLVISPQPHDGHPAHERVGRVVRDVLARMPHPATWWMWGLWAELAIPTLYLPFGESELTVCLELLEAYPGELARNDFRRVVRGRAASNTVLGSERVFGFGSGAASDQPYAELLTEAIFRGGHWYAGTRRVVDLSAPLVAGRGSHELLDDWISDRRR